MTLPRPWRLSRCAVALAIDIWILSGWPLAAEAQRFAEQVMPLLDIRPYRPPVLEPVPQA